MTGATSGGVKEELVRVEELTVRGSFRDSAITAASCSSSVESNSDCTLDKINLIQVLYLGILLRKCGTVS